MNYLIFLILITAIIALLRHLLARLCHNSFSDYLRESIKHFWSAITTGRLLAKKNNSLSTNQANPNFWEDRSNAVKHLSRLIKFMKYLNFPSIALGLVLYGSRVYYDAVLINYLSLFIVFLLLLKAIREINAYVIRGQVTDKESNRPLEKVVVEVYQLSNLNADKIFSAAATDRFGNFNLSLKAGKYQLIANKFDYQIIRPTHLNINEYGKFDLLAIPMIHTTLARQEIHNEQIKFIKN